jgi:hypothetical protein
MMKEAASRRLLPACLGLIDLLDHAPLARLDDVCAIFPVDVAVLAKRRGVAVDGVRERLDFDRLTPMDRQLQINRPSPLTPKHNPTLETVAAKRVSIPPLPSRALSPLDAWLRG